MQINQECQSCGTNWRDHLGVAGTCAKCMAWEHMAKELATILYKDEVTQQDRDRILGEYEKLKFLQR
jgi:predicted ATP-dependent serine protease